MQFEIFVARSAHSDSVGVIILSRKLASVRIVRSRTKQAPLRCHQTSQNVSKGKMVPPARLERATP